MTDNEVNKIIAEYMEQYCTHIENAWLPKYTESLDALVPVWEKLGKERFTLDMKAHKEDRYTVWRMPYGDESNGETIQQAAAHATAKAILEIK